MSQSIISADANLIPFFLHFQIAAAVARLDLDVDVRSVPLLLVLPANGFSSIGGLPAFFLVFLLFVGSKQHFTTYPKGKTQSNSCFNVRPKPLRVPIVFVVGSVTQNPPQGCSGPTSKQTTTQATSWNSNLPAGGSSTLLKPLLEAVSSVRPFAVSTRPFGVRRCENGEAPTALARRRPGKTLRLATNHCSSHASHHPTYEEQV